MPRGGVRSLLKARPSLKTPAIPPVYKIISADQSTKLVYNLVYSPRSEHYAQRTEVTGAVCGLRLSFDCQDKRFINCFFDLETGFHLLVTANHQMPH